MVPRVFLKISITVSILITANKYGDCKCFNALNTGYINAVIL